MQDGVLSDAELNDFQVHCFAVPLQPEELAGVKAVVSQKLPEVVILPPFSAAICKEGTQSFAAQVLPLVQRQQKELLPVYYEVYRVIWWVREGIALRGAKHLSRMQGVWKGDLMLPGLPVPTHAVCSARATPELL